jgi:flagellar FliL protein
MSTAAAVAAPEVPAPKKGKKKLLIIIAAVALLLVAGGGAAAFMLKKSHAAAEAAAEGDDGNPAGDHASAKAAKHDPKAIPTFVPLEPFTVNLADRDADRYAQVGITLEVADAHVGDQIKAYMPAIRNNILMALAEKTADQLMDREGKVKLAAQVRRETARAMGYEVEDPEEAPVDGEKAKPRKKAAKKPAEELPITAVHFSNFIIQ